MNTLNTSLSLALKERRKADGLSLRQVGKLTGVSQSTLSRLENLKGNLDFHVQVALSKYLHVPLSPDAVPCDGRTLENVKQVIFNDPNVRDKVGLWNLFWGTYNSMRKLD